MRYAALFALLAAALAGDPTSVDYVRDNFYQIENQLWKNVTDPLWRDMGLGGDVELTKAFVALDEQIQTIPRPSRPPLSSWLWVKASEKLQLIDGYYKSFVEFVRRQSAPGAVPAPVREWLDLAEQVLMDPKVSVAQAVRKLHEILEHVNMFRATLQDHPDLCEFQLSQHQLIYDMYNTISLTEIKGYAMMQFSWMLLRIYGKGPYEGPTGEVPPACLFLPRSSSVALLCFGLKDKRARGPEQLLAQETYQLRSQGNFTQEANLTRQRYGERTAQTATAARSALTMARRDLYRCDPPHHKEGETYAQVTRLLQGYIENEVDMNKDGTCRDNCAYYSLAERQGCFKDQYCNKQPQCNGRIIDCQYIDSDMWICPAGRGSTRRYEWIEYENGRTLGRVGSCMRGTTKVDSWWRWNLLHCSYCMCLCEDEAAEADRFFSMRESVADADSNKVVTGLRLTKLGRVFHLQIAEGTLGERGAITPSGWVPVQRFDPMDVGVRENEDYHTLTYEKRAIDLDELDSPSGRVLTGVRFRMLGSHLHFEIRSTPFNFTTGRLSPERSVWISNDNTDGAETPRKRLELYRPDVPTRSATPLPVDSTHDQYLEFTHTDFDADAAQSTVPFVDIQPVIPIKGGSLASGAGIIHRGARGSGGYIAVKLFTYDFSKHVRASPPPTSFDEDIEATEFTPVVN